MKSLKVFVLSLLFAFSTAACSDDDSGAPQQDAQVLVDAGLDATTQQDAAQQPDASEPDGATSACEPAQREFWAYDLSVMPPRYVQVPATCRAAGPHSLIYVADDIWGDSVDQAEVDDLLAGFEQETPADPTKGIYEMTTGTFGAPSDIDNNGKVILFVLELQGYQGYQFDGFIRREDVLGGNYSNQAEMVYVDGVRNDLGSPYLLGVLSHEFFHMIHLNYDQNEDHWLDETLAESSMVLCGYYGDLDGWVANNYVKGTNTSLMDNTEQYNYGAGFLFGAYMLERFGPEFLGALVADQNNGASSIEETMAAQGEDESFADLLADWGVANFLDNPAVGDGRYGYTAFDVPPVWLSGNYVPGESSSSKTVVPSGVVYMKLDVSGLAEDSTVEATVDTTNWQDLEVRMIAYSSSNPDQSRVLVGDLTAAQSTITAENVGGDFDELIFVLVNTGSASITVNSIQFAAQ